MGETGYGFGYLCLSSARRSSVSMFIDIPMIDKGCVPGGRAHLGFGLVFSGGIPGAAVILSWLDVLVAVCF